MGALRVGLALLALVVVALLLRVAVPFWESCTIRNVASGSNRWQSGAGDRQKGSGPLGAQRSQPAEGGGPEVPAVDAGEGYVLPAQGGEVLEVLVGDPVSSVPQLLDGPLDVDGVPQRYGGAQDVQTARPVRLVLVGPVAHLAEAVEEDGLRPSGAGGLLISPVPEFANGINGTVTPWTTTARR